MPVRRLPLSQQVVDETLALIDARGLRPGDRLPSETGLAETFGVSRPVVREALRSLSERGVVDVHNGRGAVLRQLDGRPLSAFFARALTVRSEAVEEVMQIRRALEGEAARLAAAHSTPDQLAELRATAASMRAALADPAAYVERDTAFHLQLAAASGNVLLGHFMDAIREPLRASIQEGVRGRRGKERIETAHARHEALLDRIEDRDAGGAAALMHAHFEDALASLADRQTR